MIIVFIDGDGDFKNLKLLLAMFVVKEFNNKK